MQLPFLKDKQKNQGGTGVVTVNHSTEPGPNTLTDHISQELLTAIEKKDVKSLRDALQALVLMINDKDNQDE